jgi:hypothetical protein
MTTFGGFPGVRIQTQGGGISGVQVGSEETLILYGNADTNNGTAVEGNPTQIGASSQADTKFGSGSELADAMKEALANGANINYLYGVPVPKVQTTENFSSATGTLSNTPILHDEGAVTVTIDGTDGDVEFWYAGGAPDTPSSSGVAYVNPYSGEFAVGNTSPSTVDVQYSYQQWDNTLINAANDSLSEGDTGVLAPLTDAESVASTLSGHLTTLRGEYKMAKGLVGAQPNVDDTVSTNDPLVPGYDAPNYTDALANDSLFVIAPSRNGNNYNRTIIPGVAGVFAGHAINEPVYNDAVSGYTDVAYDVSRSDAQAFRSAYVIPIRQAGTVRIKDNLSTSEESDWERDFWRRRIVDRVVLLSKLVGEAIIGRINDEQTRSQAETTLFVQLRGLVSDRLLKANEEGETNLTVNVYEDPANADEVNIDVGVTPLGIVKRIDETVTINT